MATEPATGGSLAELAAFLRAGGQACVVSADGSQIWAPGAQAELSRLPMEQTAPPSPAEVRQVLATRGIWIASYLLEPTPAAPANCIHYLCRDSNYHWDSLSKNGRKAIRRGLRESQVRLCSWDEFAAKGYDAYCETDIRHGYRQPSRESFETFVNLRRDQRFYDVWSAWKGEDMVSWLCVLKADDWALFEASPSRNAALEIFANNAMRYEAMRQYLINEKRRAVLTGLSSLNPNTDPRPIWKFNTRMGFEALPVRRIFKLHTMLKPLFSTRLAAKSWTWLSRAMPQRAIFYKLAGMANLASDCLVDPLAWAREMEAAQDSPQQGASSEGE